MAAGATILSSDMLDYASCDYKCPPVLGAI